MLRLLLMDTHTPLQCPFHKLTKLHLEAMHVPCLHYSVWKTTPEHYCSGHYCSRNFRSKICLWPVGSHLIFYLIWHFSLCCISLSFLSYTAYFNRPLFCKKVIFTINRTMQADYKSQRLSKAYTIKHMLIFRKAEVQEVSLLQFYSIKHRHHYY